MFVCRLILLSIHKHETNIHFQFQNLNVDNIHLKSTQYDTDIATDTTGSILNSRYIVHYKALISTDDLLNFSIFFSHSLSLLRF